MSAFRVGQGIDVHGFSSDRPLFLCGVELTGCPGLEGHSDADVALHAVADALLGAVGRGDLGEHFPSRDPRWKGASSRVFVRRALELVAESGYRLVNCDLTIVGERPRIAGHREVLRAGLADTLGVGSDAVSVKSTTSDGLGFIGRGEGMAALAVVLVEKDVSDG